jgi:lysophospholipase L1-like esterase
VRAAVAGVLAALALLAGCADGGPDGAGAAVTTPSARTQPPEVIALGDSISVGFAACGRPQACPSQSWATGDDPGVGSIAERLAANWGSEPVSATNLAVPGARAEDLPAQAGRVPEDADALVTLMIGANDVCSPHSSAMTDPAAFRASIDRTLEVLAERAPDAVIVLSSLPDLAGMYAALQGDARIAAAWAARPPCRALMGPDAVPDDVAAHVEALDAELTEACAAAAQCAWDDGAVHRWEPVAASLSDIDSFHPSAQGQAELAAAVWAALTTARPAQALLRP